MDPWLTPCLPQAGAQPAAGDKALTELRGRILAAQEELATGLIERDAEVSCSLSGPRQALLSRRPTGPTPAARCVQRGASATAWPPWNGEERAGALSCPAACRFETESVPPRRGAA